jgi:hypothetical protein
MSTPIRRGSTAADNADPDKRPDIETDAMKTVVTSAIELGACSEEAEPMIVERSASALSAEEADLLAPPPLAPHTPWIVPLSVRPDDDNGG